MLIGNLPVFQVLEAQINLDNKWKLLGSVDPYCVLTLEGESGRTAVVEGTTEPRWFTDPHDWNTRADISKFAHGQDPNPTCCPPYRVGFRALHWVARRSPAAACVLSLGWRCSIILLVVSDRLLSHGTALHRPTEFCAGIDDELLIEVYDKELGEILDSRSMSVVCFGLTDSGSLRHCRR